MQRILHLTKEVDNIVVAPYYVFLKRLHQVLKHTSTEDLYIWSLIKTCQIRPLVTRILQSLSIDEHARPVLYNLVRLERIRDDILLYQPSALNEVFFHPGDDYDDCLTLFKTPIPKTITLPQNAINFIEQVLSNSNGVSPQIWIRQLQTILRSSGPALLETVDEAAVEVCFSSWSSILKTNQNFEFLCCLDIACMLQCYLAANNVSYGSSISPYTESGAIRNWTAKAGGLLKHKSDKLIRSLLLRALYFISDKPDVTTDRAIEAATMIRSILKSIDCLALQGIIQEKENLEALNKLTQKVNQLETNPFLQVIMFDIVLNLSPASYPLQVPINGFLENLLTCVPSPDAGTQRACYVDVLRSALNPQFNTRQSHSGVSTEGLSLTDSFKRCLEFAIDQCIPGRRDSVDKVLKLEHASLLVQSISEAITLYDDAALAQHVLSIQVPEWWSMEFTTPQNPQNCAHLGICPHGLEARRQHMTLEVTNLIMKISCLHALPLSRYNYDHLSYRISQAINQNNGYICPFVTPIEHKLLNRALVSQPAKYTANLDQELAILHEKTSEMIQIHVNTTCKDLQDRCDNVEEPLRAARSDVERLENDLAKWKQDTESTAAEHGDERARLQKRIHELEQDVEAVQQIHEISKKQQMLGEVKWKAEIDALHDDNTVLEDKIANLERQEAELKGLLEEKDQAMQQIRSELDACASTRDTLHLELSEARDKEKRLLSVLFENKAV